MKIEGKRITILPKEQSNAAPDSCAFDVVANGQVIGEIAHFSLDKTAKTTEVELLLIESNARIRSFIPDILETFTRHIFKTHRIRGYIMRPSQSAKKEIAAYERAGFRWTHLPEEQELAQFGPKRYPDGTVLMKSVV